jgi:DNA-binding NarL/FixJ family response regulator
VTAKAAEARRVRRVLLVEDDPDHALLITVRLRRAPGTWTVECAGTVAEARALLERQTFDALVVDYRLGDGSGVALLAQLRADGDVTPAMVLTSQGSEDIAAEAIRAGADDYLPKHQGLEGDVLARTLVAMMERRRLADALSEAQQQRVRLDGALLMARTVAHEINNALAPVVGFADLLEAAPEVATNPRLASYVRAIQQGGTEAAQRIARLQRITRLEETDGPIENLTVIDVGSSEVESA